MLNEELELEGIEFILKQKADTYEFTHKELMSLLSFMQKFKIRAIHHERALKYLAESCATLCCIHGNNNLDMCPFEDTNNTVCAQCYIRHALDATKDKVSADQITYTVTVSQKMFPLPPGTEVVARGAVQNSKWVKGIFCMVVPDTALPSIHKPYVYGIINEYQQFRWYRECYPITTHGHLLDTTLENDVTGTE